MANLFEKAKQFIHGIAAKFHVDHLTAENMQAIVDQGLSLAKKIDDKALPADIEATAVLFAHSLLGTIGHPLAMTDEDLSALVDKAIELATLFHKKAPASPPASS